MAIDHNLVAGGDGAVAARVETAAAEGGGTAE